MRVYRVEHPLDGEGPYLGAWGIEHLKWAHNDDAHPGPRQEGLKIYGNQVCAMKTMDRLGAWFEGWWECLSNTGFYVAEYEVPDEYVEQGKIQLIFDKTMATLIKSEPIEVGVYA